MNLLKKVLIVPSLVLLISSNLFAQKIYTLEAMPLKDVIKLITNDMNLPYVVDSKFIEGKRSKKIQNIEGSKEALEKVLKEFNLELEIKNDLIVIKKMKLTSSNNLGEVDVVERLNDLSEGTNSYTLKSSSTALKLNMSARETPQTVHTITSQVIEDYNLEDLSDILGKTPGISVSTADSDRRIATSRGGYGVQAQYNNLPSLARIFGGESGLTDSAVIDHVDVLLGASGLLNGSGEPGGTVNIVTKKPSKETKGSIELELGSWNKKRAVADVGGSLNESGSIRARVVALDQSEESFRDYIGKKKKLFYAVVEGDISDDTMLNASFLNYDIYDTTADRNGLFLDNNGNSQNYSRSTFLSPSWNKWDKFSTTYTVGLDHSFSDDWKLKLNISKAEHDSDWLFGSIYSYDSSANTATFDPWAQEVHWDIEDIELYLTGNVELFGATHEFVFGSNLAESTRTTLSGSGTSSTISLNNFNPNSFATPSISYTGIDITNTKDKGIYTSGRFTLHDNLKMILGARLSSYEEDDNGSVRKENNIFTPYLGIVYDINDFSTAYASYSDIFEVQSDKNSSGEYLDPEVGSNYEIGVKGEFFDSKLQASLALFKIIKTNEAEEDTSIIYNPTNICGGYCYNAKGTTSTKGFDIGLSGDVSDNIKIALGLTEHRKEDQDRVRSFKISSSYTFSNLGLVLGGSLDTSTKSYGSWSMEEDARTLINLFGNYKINKNLDFSLNIDNVFDEVYYANNGNGYGNQYYGDPRNFSASLKWKF